ncbi:MAG: ThuA domain-containing protein [Planctomycetota bacterium]|jgi:type 1 glutamine amidotransferase
MSYREWLASLLIWLASTQIGVDVLAATQGGPSAEEVKKMWAAMLARGRVLPDEPRRVLVFSRSWGYKHSAIPYGAKALEIMGEKTGAFEAVITNDEAMFEPENLKQFDAVVLNNTNNEIFLPEDFDQLSAPEKERLQERDAMLKESFVDFLSSGGGLAVIHAGVASFRHWPEFGEIIGARFDNHPWGAGSTVTLSVEEPDHPVAAAFKEPYFIVSDEIYQVKAPYSRDKVRVLLSVDPDRTRITPKQREAIHREDMDFAMTWIKRYGKGRVFYCALGHEHPLFWNPIVLQHYLDGIQFVLGDLTGDAAPRIDSR